MFEKINKFKQVLSLRSKHIKDVNENKVIIMKTN